VQKILAVALAALSLLAIARGAERVALFVGVTSDDAQAPFAPAPVAELGAERVALVDTRRVVPSAGLPADVRVLDANNNLDAVRHSDGRVYLAFRSAPNHFASPDTEVFVVSSADERTWQLEARFALGTDLREPRLLSLGSRLLLYVSKLGKRPYAFEPAGAWVAEKAEAGAVWSGLAELDLPGYIVWRVKAAGGRAYMSAYRGGGNLYNFSGEPIAVRLLTSSDGRDWQPLDAAHPDVFEGGVSEAEFEFAADGALLAVGRNEAGDSRYGFGSVVCDAPPGEPWRWACQADSRKYDSPLMFTHAGEVYLVARRTANEDGAYDRGVGWGSLRSIINQLAYISTAKRCSLFHVVRAPLHVAFVMDLPSRGDTCFPARIDGPDPDDVVLYNYSSDIAGPDVAWSVGQRRPTYIYRHVLRIQPNAGVSLETKSVLEPDAPGPAAPVAIEPPPRG
jgi:hypothetical protein